MMQNETRTDQRQFGPRYQDLTGQRFGRLVALRPAKRRAKNGNVRWLCQCDCGNLTTVDGQRLRGGMVRSCGCIRRQVSRQAMHNNPKLRAHIGDTSGFFDQNGVPTAAYQLRARNRSGVLGVSFDAKTQLWHARMMRNGHLVLNRAFKHFDDAVAARHAAEREYLPQQYQHLQH